MTFHPHARAFGWSLAYGLVAFAIGALLGWSTGGNWLTVGMVCGGLSWLYFGAVLLDMVGRTYIPRPVTPAIEHPSESNELIDPDWIEIKCTQSNDVHILRNLPVDYDTLQRYAVGTQRDEKKTVYNDWKKDEILKDQDTYKVFVDWMVDNHFGCLDQRKTLVISERGKDLLEDILLPQFQPPSPTETGYQRKLYIYGDMNK